MKLDHHQVLKPASWVSAFAGAALLGASTAAVPQEFDWKQQEGSSVNALLVSHQFVEALKPLVPEFEEMTGISVTLDVLAEQAAFEKLLAEPVVSSWVRRCVHDIAPEQLAVCNRQLAGAVGRVHRQPGPDPPGLRCRRFLPGRPELESLDKGSRCRASAKARSGRSLSIRKSYLMAYRPSVFKELGLEVPKTYDELLAIAGQARYGIGGIRADHPLRQVLGPALPDLRHHASVLRCRNDRCGRQPADLFGRQRAGHG